LPSNAKCGAGMAKSSNAGCGYIFIGLIVLFAIGKCSGGDETASSPRAETNEVVDLIDEPKLEPASGDALRYDTDDTVYVTASALNGRPDPSASGDVLTKLAQGSSARVVARSGEWLKVSSGEREVWVSSSHVSSTRPAARPRRQSRPAQRQNFYGSGCPCSGRLVCIGPRGGRYCITSGGNKRYGV